jgi:DNA-binding MarR family transcriptional regulator
MGTVLDNRLKQRPSNDARLDALLNLKIAAHFMRSMEEGEYSASGMTIPQFNVLAILKGAHPGGHPRYDITRRMVEPAPDITRIIDRLVQKGFVVRERTEADRRLAIHRITRKGIQMLDRLRARKESFLGHLAARLTRAECEQLSNLCEKIYAQSD